MSGRVRKGWRNGKDSLGEFQTHLSEQARRAARRTDYYVHDHAWGMMACTAGLAFATGFLLSRANQEVIADRVSQEVPNLRAKVRRLNSLEFVQSSIPLVLLLWKALSASRQARKPWR